MNFEQFGKEVTLNEIEQFFSGGNIAEGRRQALLLLEKLESVPQEINQAALHAQDIDVAAWRAEQREVEALIARLRVLLAQYPTDDL